MTIFDVHSIQNNKRQRTHEVRAWIMVPRVYDHDRRKPLDSGPPVCQWRVSQNSGLFDFDGQCRCKDLWSFDQGDDCADIGF